MKLIKLLCLFLTLQYLCLLSSQQDISQWMASTTLGFNITSPQPQGGGSTFGYSISSAGDFNKDGYDDVIIGDFQRDQVFILYGSSTFPTTLDVGSMAASQGVRLFSNSATWFGYSVASAGDFNKDGYGDIIIGDPQKKEAYIVYGSSTFPTPFDIGSMTASQGVKLFSPQSRFGTIVAPAGDFNKDGYDDVIIGDPSKHKVYIVYGSSNFPTPFDIGLLNELHGVSFTSSSRGSDIGDIVASAGDFNKDGYADVIIIDSYEVYIVFGSSNVPASFDLASIQARQGVKLTYANHTDTRFYKCSSAGDFNKDGYDDIIVGSLFLYKTTENQEWIILYGNSNNSGTLDVNSITSAQGVRLQDTEWIIGYSVATGGDFNKDGYADIVIGNNPWVYIVYGGNSSNFSTPISLKSMTAQQGVRINSFYNGFGGSIAAAGDFNKDGYADVILGYFYVPVAKVNEVFILKGYDPAEHYISGNCTNYLSVLLLTVGAIFGGVFLVIILIIMIKRGKSAKPLNAWMKIISTLISTVVNPAITIHRFTRSYQLSDFQDHALGSTCYGPINFGSNELKKSDLPLGLSAGFISFTILFFTTCLNISPRSVNLTKRFIAICIHVVHFFHRIYILYLQYITNEQIPMQQYELIYAPSPYCHKAVQDIFSQVCNTYSEMFVGECLAAAMIALSAVTYAFWGLYNEKEGRCTAHLPCRKRRVHERNDYRGLN